MPELNEPDDERFTFAEATALADVHEKINPGHQVDDAEYGLSCDSCDFGLYEDGR